MARVNITTKPGQVADQQLQLDLSTLLDTPSDSLSENILQPTNVPIQGVTADAPQVLGGAPVEDTLAYQQEQQALAQGRMTEEEKVAASESDVDRQNLYYPEKDSRLSYGGWDISNAFESDGERDGGFALRTKATAAAVHVGDYKFGIEKQTMEGKRVQGDRGFSTLTSVISNDHQAFDASNPDWGVGYNPDYIAIGAAVAEDTLLNRLDSVDAVEDEQGRIFSDDGLLEQAGAFEKPYVKSAMNKDLGNNINREWKLLTGGPDSVTSISDEQATVLGDAFLELYYNVNKGVEGAELMRRVSPTGKTGEVTFSLTPLGITQLGAGKALRKRIFYKPAVEPYKTPPVREGMGKTPMSRFFIKPIKKVKGDEVIKQAMFNLSQIAHAVIPARLRLVTSIILPTLAAYQAGAVLTPQQEVYANILGFGPRKMAAFRAKEKTATLDKSYDAEKAMSELRNSIAQYYHALAQNRKGVNYLTWAMQSATGRVFVEQSGLDPTSSKLVRFALGNPVPVMIRPNSRQEANLREMYAMHLVKDGDMMLPVERDKALSLATPQLVRWGRRLQGALDATMSVAQTDAIHESVENKVGLKTPEFPQFNELGLDPKEDAELLEMIDKAGDDGLLYMDGLMDFVKYYDNVIINKKPHASQFNAYADGKTNGLAAFGMMIGDHSLAFLTGVLRVNNKKLLDNGDIRDKLKETLVGNINTVGLNYGDYSNAPAALTAVASRVFSEKALNKYTTMTFGYGRALQSIKKNLNEFLAVLYEEAKDAEAIVEPERRKVALEGRGLVGFKDAYESLLRELSNPRNVGAILLEPYITGLKQVVSYEAMLARATMKAVAYLSALADIPLEITGPAGMVLQMGGFVTKANKPLKYSMSNAEGDRMQRQAQSYSADRRTAASATIIEKPGGDEIRVGMKAANSSIVSPQQSTDAAVIALTHTGESMARQISASNGNPHALPIYDALKMDANGFDVIVKESNKNWIKATMDWDVFGEYEDARRRAEVALKRKLSRVSPDTKVSLEVNGESQMMGYLTEVVDRATYKGRDTVPFFVPENLAYMLAEATDPGRDSETEYVDQKAERMAFLIKRRMADDVGFKFGAKTATAKQVQHFNKLLSDYLDTKQVLSKIKKNAKAGQAKIREDILDVYQYYAH